MISILTATGLVLLALGMLGVIISVVRKVPLLVKLEDIAPPPAVGLAEKINNRVKGIRYSTYRPLILGWLEKNLRKFRVLLSRLDNLFISLIKRSRERSQVWTIRSHAWMEHTRLKKKEKLQVLEKLDKMEIFESMEKITKEVAKEEDQALREKIETINESSVEPEKDAPISEVVPELPVSEEEKKHIDLIAQNHKNIEAYRALGFIYLKQKNYSDARACFRRVLKLDSQDEEVKIKLEEIKGLRKKRTQS